MKPSSETSNSNRLGDPGTSLITKSRTFLGLPTVDSSSAMIRVRIKTQYVTRVKTQSVTRIGAQTVTKSMVVLDGVKWLLIGFGGELT